MAEIKFFSEARLSTGYEDFSTFQSPRIGDSLSFGNHQFTLTSYKPIHGILSNGSMDITGFEETYSNADVSQEEADALMQQYRKETGQA